MHYKTIHHLRKRDAMLTRSGARGLRTPDKQGMIISHSLPAKLSTCPKLIRFLLPGNRVAVLQSSGLAVAMMVTYFAKDDADMTSLEALVKGHGSAANVTAIRLNGAFDRARGLDRGA